MPLGAPQGMKIPFPWYIFFARFSFLPQGENLEVIHGL